jgi:hypothetical protein
MGLKTRGNFVTERGGVNHVRSVVEAAGCFFKEIDLQYDVGHDATILLVVDGFVQPKEVAVQIKSGSSYISPSGNCRIPASNGHVSFWSKHDLTTLGIVFDPAEGTAYWIDLQTATRRRLGHFGKEGAIFEFRKAEWNRFDTESISTILVPTLLGEAPKISLDATCAWIRSDDADTHDLGIRTMRARHRSSAEGWSALIDVFLERSSHDLSPEVALSFAKLLGHDDIGFYTGEIPREVRTPLVERLLQFGPAEISKLLSFVDDNDFERPSFGYSLMPLWGARSDSLDVLAAVAADRVASPEVRDRASRLVQWQRTDPDWWRCWRRGDGGHR